MLIYAKAVKSLIFLKIQRMWELILEEDNPLAAVHKSTGKSRDRNAKRRH